MGLLKKMSVSVSEAKSLVSDNGSLEFAKQFWSDRLTKNLSPISAKAVLAAQTLIGVSQLAAKYGMSKVSVLRFAGAGYRVRSRMLSPSLSKRWRRMIIVADKPLGKSRLPLDLWLGSLSVLI